MTFNAKESDMMIKPKINYFWPKDSIVCKNKIFIVCIIFKTIDILN